MGGMGQFNRVTVVRRIPTNDRGPGESLAALMKKKPVWILGLVTGAVGLFYFANGFFLFVN